MRTRAALIAGFCTLIAALLIAILVLVAVIDHDDNCDTPESSAELEPKIVGGKYQTSAFSDDQLDRMILIHFNLKELATPLFLCPIERYIDLNPNVELMIFTPNSSLIEENLPQTNYPQIRYYDYEDLPELFSGLPIEPLYLNKVYERKPEWANLILTDLIRLAAVYKYGGTYSDLDIIPNRIYEDGEDFLVCPQDNNYIAGGYFRFPKHNPLMWLVMQRIAEFHPEDEWASFSTVPLTHVLRDRCGVTYDKTRWTEPKKNLDSECANVKVFPPEALYPIHWSEEEKYVGDFHLLSSSDLSRLENSIGMHWWNGPLKRGGCLNETSVLATLVRQACPRTYEKHAKAMICDATAKNTPES